MDIRVVMRSGMIRDFTSSTVEIAPMYLGAFLVIVDDRENHIAIPASEVREVQAGGARDW